MLELDFLMQWKVVLELLCTLWRWLNCQWFGTDHTRNVAIASVNSLNVNFNFS